MGAALRTEYRKLVTTRLWWVLLLAMVGYMAFIAPIMAFVVTQGGDMGTVPGGEGGGPLPPDAIVRTVYTIAVTLGYTFPLVVGTLAVTTEFRHQTITPTLLAEPRRSVVLGAKLLAGAVLGLVFGVVGTATVAGAGALVVSLAGQPTYLDLASTWRVLALSAVALALWAVVGVGFGSVLTNQVAAIVVILAFTQFLEPLLRFGLAATSWGDGIARFFPGAAAEALSGGSLYAEMGATQLLSPLQGAAVLIGYALLFAAIGRFTTFRRDIT
ncbi:ABC transporter permease [Cellulomonas algicola]|uniref:ABC transporter permease n=1 Tax=Cellulomonas algicola TaxID=2071633 RepID=A0A401V2R9_9CELL|nr:ABC transporter permease [Cellulomonas algicola]GCD21205.1 ABC transporter permease [Cellulomonas algicola]